MGGAGNKVLLDAYTESPVTWRAFAAIKSANAGSFFGAGNGNYDQGAGTALSGDALATGIARVLAQRDEEHRDLDIRPRTLLVPPELQQMAKQSLQSDFIQRANNYLPTGNALMTAPCVTRPTDRRTD